MNRLVVQSLRICAWCALVLSSGQTLVATDSPPGLAQPANTWVKRSPRDEGPLSPRMGYEGACVWDSRHGLLVRYGGHNQGGGGEQGAEVWTYDLLTGRWQLKEPNTSPPGVCCNTQNLYDPQLERYLRFPLFSGSHGWQWWRELYLNDSSVWTYDLAANRWRNARPLPEPRLAGLRCASWDSDHHVAVVFGGEGGREGTVIYDPWRNEWRWPKPQIEPAARSGGNMAYDAARKLHVLFGSQFDDDRHTWTYDLASNRWRDMQPAVMPPTKENDAVLTYDPINRVVLALVKITTGQDDDARHEVQTWAYDVGVNRWQRMNPAQEPDAGGNRTRQLNFAPQWNLVILENCTSRPREQQIWTYRYAAAEAGAQPRGGDTIEVQSASRPAADRPEAADAQIRKSPRIVEDAVVSVLSPTRVEIAWKAPADPTPVAYHVERAVVEVWSEDQLRRLKVNTPPLDKPSVGAIRRIGTFQRLTGEPIEGNAFVDESIDLATPQAVQGEPIYERDLHGEHLDRGGRPYRYAVFAYRVVGVDRSGTLSGPSPAVLTIPASPQQVFGREDGTSCDLKWEPNSGKGIAGYRVYRLDGRWNSDPVSRLTPDPVAATSYQDAAAGRATRRYYVVAVDALGQEGFPSSPVWFQREWGQYYEPFIRDWHQ